MLIAVLAVAGTVWIVLLVRSGGRSWHPRGTASPRRAGCPVPHLA